MMQSEKVKTNKYPATHKKYIRQKYDCIRTSFTTGVWNGRIRRSYKDVVHRIRSPYTIVVYDHRFTPFFFVYGRIRSQILDLGSFGVNVELEKSS